MLAAAMLLKSKRVPPRLDLIVAPPSRQVLEVLGQSGALVDLIATGARIIEPDRRVLTGELYPVPQGQISLRTSDAEPRTAGCNTFVVASAETLAYAVATGNVGDPRSFKRPVRVTVPRALPTDDVLIMRESRVEPVGTKRPPPTVTTPPLPLRNGCTLELVAGLPAPGDTPTADHALLLGSIDEVRRAAMRASGDGSLRTVVAPFIPSGLVAMFSGAGVLALSADAATLRSLKGQKTIAVPPIGPDMSQIPVTAGKTRFMLSWLAIGIERTWTINATSRPSPQAARVRPT
jgi:aconitate hydratase